MYCEAEINVLKKTQKNYGITILNSSVVECLLSIQKVPGSILG